MRRVVFISSKKPETIELALNRLSERTTVMGSPVWDGKKWIVWLITLDKKIQSGSLD